MTKNSLKFVQNFELTYLTGTDKFCPMSTKIKLPHKSWTRSYHHKQTIGEIKTPEGFEPKWVQTLTKITTFCLEKEQEKTNSAA